LFKEIAGVSPIQYLIGLRLKKACDLLEHSSKSVLEIALDCGFENISYFIRKFKEVKGCTPKEYRSKTAVHLQKKECYNMERKNTV
jgi:AraC-like DNA-binding protein